MAAEENLNPELFHGTAASIPVGASVRPANAIGVKSHWGRMGASQGQPSEENAYATASEDTAWHFAETAGQTAGDRPAVYKVAPHPEMRRGVFSDLKEYVSPEFKTTDRIDTKPDHQGTFPSVNWNQFARQGTQPDRDANHPRPEYQPEDEDHRDMVQDSQHHAHQKWERETTPSFAPGATQPPLFGPEAIPRTVYSDIARAKAHDLRHLVNTGRAPGEMPMRGDYNR